MQQFRGQRNQNISGIFYYLNTTYYLKDKQDEFQNWEAILDKHLEFGNKIRSTTFLNFHIFFKYGKIEMQKKPNGFVEMDSMILILK